MTDARSHRYTPLDPSQWDVEIGDVAGALDELAKVGPGGIDEFDAYDSVGLTDVTTAATVPLGTTRVNTGTQFTLASDQVTLTGAGLHQIAPRLTVAADGALGAFVQVGYVEINGVEVAGSRFYVGAG